MKLKTRVRHFGDHIRRTFAAWRGHNPALIAAGLSYFALFSLIPLTVLTITLVGHIFSGSNAHEMVFRELEEVFSPEAARSISNLLGRVEQSAGPASLVSALVLAWVGARLFVHLQTALSSVWDITPPQRSRLGKVKAYLGDRLRAMGATLGFGLLAFAFLMMDVMLGSVRQALAEVLPQTLIFRILPAASLVLSLVLFAVAFAAIYRWLPAAHPGWPAVWSGAVVASLLFAVGRVALTIYFHERNFASLFGAAGSIAVILVWVYYSMQILLFGATFAFVVGERRRNPSRPATP